MHKSKWLHQEGDIDAERALVGNSSLGTRGISRVSAGAAKGVGSEARGTETDTDLPSPPKSAPRLAILLKPLIVNNTRKWFGDADIRVDVMVSHGGRDSSGLYHPGTFRFPRVSDGDDLASSENGLLVFYGQPEHFLCLSVILSRDTSDTDDLASLIRQEASSEGVQKVLMELAATASSPHVAAVRTALNAALMLCDISHKLISQISPKCLGLHRSNWLGNRHSFGLGRHPEENTICVKDFEFAYDILLDSHGRLGGRA